MSLNSSSVPMISLLSLFSFKPPFFSSNVSLSLSSSSSKLSTFSSVCSPFFSSSSSSSSSSSPPVIISKLELDDSIFPCLSSDSLLVIAFPPLSSSSSISLVVMGTGLNVPSLLSVSSIGGAASLVPATLSVSSCTRVFSP